MLKAIIFQSLILAFLMSLTAISSNAQNSDPANCKPEVDMSSLLSNLSANGYLSIGKLYATCLPMPAKKSQSAYEYHPYDGGKFSMTLKTADGKTVNTFVWYGEKIFHLWEFTRYEILGGQDALKKLSAGNYTLDFAVEDKVFQSFPFSLSIAEGKDQFNPKPVYLLDGAWRNYATLYAPKRDRFIKLTVWMRDANNIGDYKPTIVPYRVRLVREKDKQVLAEDSSKLALTSSWQSASLGFRKPNYETTKDYSEFKLNEVLAQDGNYLIELTVDGKPYATYKLNVKNGMLNNQDLAQMEKERYKIILPLAGQLSK